MPSRTLPDDTLIVVLSDTHIGGDGGRDIFETPGDLAAMLRTLDDHAGPVELVLAGDFFDFLRIARVADGENRASATIDRPEYRELFATLARFAAGEGHRVVYLPGNHDAEMWWDAQIRAELERRGLVHELALSYAAAFASEPDRVVYCEHGNQFDPANAKHDYADPLDTPLGDHVVTDLAPRLATSRRWSRALPLGDIDRIFPLATLPEWIAARLFYALVTRSVRWLFMPLLIAYVAFEVAKYALGVGDATATAFVVELAYEVGLLLLVFGAFFFVARRAMPSAVRSAVMGLRETGERGAEAVDAAVEEIRGRLERGEPPPLGAGVPGRIAVFVSGHTHAPSLTGFDMPGGGRGALVNSGCWLRQLRPVPGRLRAPAVFVAGFVQTHVRIRRSDEGLEIEVWERPRPAPQRRGLAERLAVAGRVPAEPAAGEPPRVRARARVDPTAR